LCRTPLPLLKFFFSTTRLHTFFITVSFVSYNSFSLLPLKQTTHPLIAMIFWPAPYTHHSHTHCTPPVTIYKFPITAISSITNRVTGVALTAGVTLIGGLTLIGGDATALMSTIGNTPILGTVAKATVAFPLVFHYLGGIRHIMWDKMPDTHLNNESVEKSSYMLIGSSAAITLGIALTSI